MHVYENSGKKMGYCFVCKAYACLNDLDIPNPIPVPQTNLEEKNKYIQGLSTRMIRGLQLPFDHLGYYIQYPGTKFYKRRNWIGEPRYTAPSGHRPPLLIMPGTSSHLVVVEGEMNALSLYDALPDEVKIVSPGPASDFMRHIKAYDHYYHVTLILDNDASGIVHGWQTKETLLSNGVRAKLVLVNRDFNDMLDKDGKEALLKYYREVTK
jgi:hypothetical protein